MLTPPHLYIHINKNIYIYIIYMICVYIYIYMQRLSAPLRPSPPRCAESSPWSSQMGRRSGSRTPWRSSRRLTYRHRVPRVKELFKAPGNLWVASCGFTSSTFLFYLFAFLSGWLPVLASWWLLIFVFSRCFKQAATRLSRRVAVCSPHYSRTGCFKLKVLIGSQNCFRAENPLI